MSRARGAAVTCAVLSLFLLAGCARNPAPQQPAPAAAVQARGDSAATGGRQQGPRPYRRVVTGSAITSTGLVTVHRVDDKLLFEIPRPVFGRDMVLLRRLAAGRGSSASAYVRFEREGNRVLLRQLDYDVTADSAAAIARGVQRLRFGPIIASMDVAAWGPDSAAVVDATKLFTTNIREMAAVESPNAERSFVRYAFATPTSIEVDAVQTGNAPRPSGPRRSQATTAGRKR
jgi:hypothetical protein